MACNCCVCTAPPLCMAGLCILALLSAACTAERMVAIPLPTAHSHLAVIHRISVELAARGHEIMFVIPECDLPSAKRLGSPRGLRFATFQTPFTHAQTRQNCREQRFRPGIRTIVEFARQLEKICLDLLEDPILTKQLQDFNASVIVGDFNNVCAFAYQALHPMPHIVVSNLPVIDPIQQTFLGIDNSLAVVPQFGTALTARMTFVERLKNVGMYALATVFNPEKVIGGELQRRHGVQKGNSPQSLAWQAVYIFSVDFALEYPRALPPKVHFVGPFLPHPPQPLPAELQAYMAGAGEAGVVYASLGTVAAVGADEYHALAAALSALHTRVLWKLGDGDLPDGMDVHDLTLGLNVKVVKWAPQNDLLGHPQTKAFLTHAGVNSLYEAAYHAVPIVSIPLFADQPDNAAKAVYHGFGLTITEADFTVDKIRAALERVLLEPSFREAAQRVSKRRHGPGPTPVQKAADLVERVLLTGGEQYLRMPAADLPWYKNYLLDVAACMLSIAAAVVAVLYVAVRLAIGAMRGAVSPRKQKTH